MTEMLKISYKNLYGRGFFSKEEYQKKLKMYRPDELMEVSKEEYDAKTGKAPAEKKKKEKGIFD
jgi:hypothetical protein